MDLETKYIKINALLLFAIIPLSIVGYLFAISYESLFYIYEWLLALLIISSITWAVVSIVKIKTPLRWISSSILAFLVQFSVLCLFLGPFTVNRFFYVFYVITFLEVILLIITLKKVKTFRYLPILFLIISAILTLYMIFLNSLWGSNLS
ncbi:hypothetical protein BCI9360_00506 [Bacillus sp. CECT 9360]|nr:hypothetical protein BCI9360_00506 [Bacillus sp. CECT 9360]